MQITLPDDLRVAERARAAGFRTVEDYLRKLVEQDVERDSAALSCPVSASSNEDWIRDFRAFIQSLRSHNPSFDDSRESIYPVR